MLVGRSGKSPDMIYFGRDVDPVKHMLAYGSPVKALVHPEIGGSKSEDRAVSGTYTVDFLVRASLTVRAGSTPTAMLPSTWVASRWMSDALDPAPDDAVRANAQWTDPAFESLERRIWTLASPPPTVPFILNILGGEFRPDALENAVTLMTSSRVHVVTIDKYEVGGYEQDITGDD
eukprot:4369185-Prymnesium_polylepis.1